MVYCSRSTEGGYCHRRRRVGIARRRKAGPNTPDASRIPLGLVITTPCLSLDASYVLTASCLPASPATPRNPQEGS